MGAHSVSKFIDFCYGHRIPGHGGRCRHLHGHGARVEIVCTGPLDDLGMVVDFGDIKRIIEAWILEHWDHRVILQRDDPLAGVLADQGEPLFILDGPTTAENLAGHLFGVARDAGLPVSAVRFWETPDSSALYTGP